MNVRAKRYLAVFSFYTAVNIFLLAKLRINGDLRADCTQNYIQSFHIWDFLIFAVFFGAVWTGGYAVCKKVMPYLGRKFVFLEENRKQGVVDKYVKWKVFGCIWCVWFFFFLIFYPGTAMNDTIYILEEPWLLSAQHPVVYNLYTYGLFRLGSIWWNENWGLALISLVQITAMSYVISTAIALMRRGVKKWLCWAITAYFSFAPIFSTYAVSAIKDTPFCIWLFSLLILLYYAYESQGEEWGSKKFQFKVGICLWGMISFRANGLVIVAGMTVLLIMAYKNWRREILLLVFSAIVIAEGMDMVLKPAGVEKLFQESVGMQLQQVAASVNKGRELTAEQEDYLYQLFPEELWGIYAPCCVDVIKWHEEFNREFLNETKGEFLKIWTELFVRNPVVYVEAHILNTYGVWGIETRNEEQYYFKDIYENDLNLYQKSPLPECIRTLFYTYYCNRFTYRYLSAGTAFWILAGEGLYLLYQRKYRLAVVLSPVGMLFLSLLAASPIAFSFRYVFVLALIFPFSIVWPFIGSRE
ncbi:MAG: hypothetical protein HFI43_01475 [Lachnospiraceae bacterium]|jgi:hypothetical protein|nr:hypothetical protein [Lachnospiraceae bacterium]